MSLCNVVSEENRKLMQEILERSAQNQDEMTGRVTALLAGSALTTKAGVRIQRRDTVEQVDYTAVGEWYMQCPKIQWGWVRFLQSQTLKASKIEHFKTSFNPSNWKARYFAM